ncbi:hypothetical protein BKA69DRAFT_289779 [Paraphysoderma sedebokerense]|nr:hypothetical protein BKA69DRAFT_289779 [Paraphysoderma sedebokerense]
MMYIPNPNFNGNDSFVFKVADRVNNVMTNSTPATVSIFVSSVPDPPVAYERLVSVQEDSAVAINITITDVDTPLANVLIVIDSLPSNGHIGFLENSASLVNITAVPYTIPPGHHTIKYYPAPDYFGPDRLTLHANDGLNDSNIVSVSIVVQPLNDYPIARAGFITTNEDQGSIIRFRVDDVDQPPSVKQRIKILTWNNTLGDLYQVNSDGIKYGFSLGPNTEVADELNRLWFEPKSDASGYINLTFTATDALNAISDPALITIQTISINDEPFIYGCNKDIILVDTPTINITLTAGDPDKDDALFFHLISVPRKGRLLHEGSEILQNDMIRRGMSGTSDSSVVLRFEGSKMGGGNPFDNFTYVVFDEAGARTEPCTVHFKVRCTPPQVNNIFEMNGDICAPCPKGAICSQDGSTPIFAGRGYWLHPGDNKTLLTCMPESACVGQQSQICAKGYEGPRCGMCEKGHYRRNLECIPCFENQTIIVVFVLIALGLSVVFLYVMINFSGKGPR